MTPKPDLTVPVDLGSRSYDILIGDNLLSHIDHYLAPFIKGSKVHIVTDETVYGLHGQSLKGLTCDYGVTILPPGEAQKSFVVLQKVLDAAFTQGLGRNDLFIAFGGGVIGDLTGFAASIYKRGCRFIQIPTTLLAQVDSSVGGKTAINVPQGKNLVGAFYQPQLVLSDTSVLQTLPARQVKAGYAEILKYALLGDVSFFDWLDENGSDVLALKPASIARAVAVSCEAKARIVAEDEQERGVRALLNLGHTFGHALEAEAGYDGDLLHGEAVSIGMEMAAEMSAALGLCSKADVARIKAHLAALNMPTLDTVSHLMHPKKLLTHMKQDKKNTGDLVTLILLRAIGGAFVSTDTKDAQLSLYLDGLQGKAHA